MIKHLMLNQREVRMRKLVVLMLILALCVSVAFAQGKAESKSTGPIIMKLGHGIQNSHPAHFAAVQFAEEVNTKTNGQIEIQVYPNRQLGEERELVEGLQLGTVDFVITSTGPLVSFVPEIGVVDLPFLFTSSEHAYEVLDGEVGQNILAKFDSKGIVGLSFMENGWRSISANKKIEKPSDLVGMKIRTMENQIHMAAFRALGASPVPMVWGEVYTSLQQGVIDGQENPPVILATNALWEVQKYYALTNHFYTPQMFLMSKGSTNKLSAEQMAIIKEAAKNATDFQRAKMAELDEEYIKTLTDNKMEVYEVNRTAFQNATKAVYDQYGSNFGVDVIEKIISMGK
jgi:tripartite ATP-independent transporter DctP family solute receptor